MGASAQNSAHQGQIVVQYRKQKKWTQGDLALALQVDKRTVQRMEKEVCISNDMRKKMLIGLLGIPATLLGMEKEPRLQKAVGVKLSQDRMSFFEDQMITRWDMYHYGGTTRAARGLETWTQEIARLTVEAKDTAWQQRAYSLLAVSYQLQSSTYRDMLAYEESHDAYNRALKLSRTLNNPELIASAMASEGLTLLQEERPEDAIRCLRSGLEVIRNVGLPNLKGYILQALSEAYAKVQEPRLSVQSIELAEKALERAESSHELSHARITLTTVTAQKGVNAALLNDSERAITLIDRSLTKYDPTMIRARSRLTAQKAEAYYHLGHFDTSAATAEDALTLARSVGSSKTIARVKKLHTKLAHLQTRDEPSIARLGALLIVK